MTKKDWIHLIIILLLLAFGYYRYTQRIYRLNNSQILMDTQVEISIESKDRNLKRILEKSFDRIEMYDNKFSYYKQDSELFQMNNNPDNEIFIDSDFHDIFFLADHVYKTSNALYDVSLGQLTDIWDFSKAEVPDSSEIQLAQKNIGWNKIKLSKNHIERPYGIKINLGSISKGYIVDKVMDYIVKQSVEEAYINAGGDIKVFSKSHSPVRIGIQHPRIANDIIATLEVTNKAVVTSGDYERFFIKDNIRYHHIINPKTGYPSRKTISVTVISDSASIADALSTALFVMEPEDGIEMINNYPGTEAIIYYAKENNNINSDKQIYSLKSKGIKKYLVSEKSVD